MVTIDRTLLSHRRIQAQCPNLVVSVLNLAAAINPKRFQFERLTGSGLYVPLHHALAQKQAGWRQLSINLL